MVARRSRRSASSASAAARLSEPERLAPHADQASHTLTSPRPAQAGRGTALLALPALVGGMLCVQVGAVLAKLLFPVLGAAGTASLRVVLAAVILLPLLRRRGGARLRWNRPMLRAVLAYGVCLGVMNTVFYAALARLPLGVTVSIEFIGPLALALLGSRRAIDLAWVGLAVAGLLLLLQPWQSTHRLDPLGVLLALAAGLSWALYILTGRRLGRHVEGVSATALGMAVASLVVLPATMQALPVAITSPHLLALAFGMALMSSAVPYSIEMVAMRRMSMRGFSVLMSLEPAIAAITGLILLGEQLSAFRWLAIAGIVAASLGSALSDPPPDGAGPREAA